MSFKLVSTCLIMEETNQIGQFDSGEFKFDELPNQQFPHLWAISIFLWGKVRNWLGVMLSSQSISLVEISMLKIFSQSGAAQYLYRVYSCHFIISMELKNFWRGTVIFHDITKLSCIAHFEGTKSALIKLTDHSAAVLTQSVQQWKVLFKEPEKSVCEGVGLDAVVTGADIHKGCYARLTNRNKVETAKRKYSEVGFSIYGWLGDDISIECNCFQSIQFLFFLEQTKTTQQDRQGFPC